MGARKRVNMLQRQKEGKQPLIGKESLVSSYQECYTMLGRSVIYYLLYLEVKYALRRYA